MLSRVQGVGVEDDRGVEFAASWLLATAQVKALNQPNKHGLSYRIVTYMHISLNPNPESSTNKETTYIYIHICI